MVKTIVISSGKGGVGKTVTAINLASALNSLGKETILVDSNLTTPNVAVNLGAPVIPITLNHVLQGRKPIQEAIYQHYSGTKIVPSSLALKDLRGISALRFRPAIDELKKHADYIIIDSAAGLGHEALLPFSVADELFIVTNPETAAITDALKTIKVAEKMNKQVSVIINRIRKDKKELSDKEIKAIIEKPILARIPEDTAIRESLMLRDSVIHTHPRSSSAKAYRRLAEKIAGIKPEPKEERKENKTNRQKTSPGFFRWMFKED
ncbi:MAG: cell division ATPase MinD [Candidatus Pacearchaeota archaeon]|nr:cell division ATPase MinD [Candidatus Pacearchaeota archaeon]